MNRFAKIVATLGPSSSDEATLRALIEAGMDVARLNFSHGTHEEHANRYKILRRLSEELGKPVSILMDLQGPKLRIGNLKTDFVELKSGDTVALSSTENPKNLREGTIFIPFDVPNLHEALSLLVITSSWMMASLSSRSSSWMARLSTPRSSSEVNSNPIKASTFPDQSWISLA